MPCLSANNPLLAGRYYDVAVVDEAGQITLPAVLGPLMIARSFVLVRGAVYALGMAVSAGATWDECLSL